MVGREEYLMDVGGNEMVAVRFERADPTDTGIAGCLIDIDLQTFTEATFSRFAASALLRHGSVFVLRHDGAVIGTAVCVRSWHDPDEALLLSIGLLHGWRGRGLGTRFVQSILRELTTDGFRALTLEVDDANERAVHVYESLGFEHVRTVDAAPSSRRRLLVLRRALAETTAQPDDNAPGLSAAS
jgi:ribosomal protein S18 acetylase RimI-like enzyme